MTKLQNQVTMPKNYIFFSKTNWNEIPRIRHQLANMLRQFGCNVFFFQKPFFLWNSKARNTVNRIDESLVLLKTKQLIHHQLRFFKISQLINAHYEKKQITDIFNNLFLDDFVVINFNYDYFFLRDIFINNKIVTIINDDFVAQSKFFNGVHVIDSLSKTCRSSNLVLAVSEPLLKQLSSWCIPKLFLPWSDRLYAPSTSLRNKDSVLLWGNIDDRLDLDLIENSAAAKPKVNFFIFGPRSKKTNAYLFNLINRTSNIFAFNSTKLDEMELDRFFCAIIPYKKNIKDIEAVSLSNKSLQLMARGLPLVVHGMPHFYEHVAIFKSFCQSDFLRGIDFCQSNYKSLQSEIKEFVNTNQITDRFNLFAKLLSNS